MYIFSCVNKLKFKNELTVTYWTGIPNMYACDGVDANILEISAEATLSDSPLVGGVGGGFS